MSEEYVRWAFQTDCGSATTKAVLVTLAALANSDGVCATTTRALADKCEMCIRTAYKNIQILKKLGLIRSIAIREHGANVCTHYHLRKPEAA